MTNEVTEKKLAKKLAKIQQDLKAPKGQYNSYSKYYYRNAEDILEALKPLLGELILTVNDEVVLIGERYYIKATATIGDGEEEISSHSYAREADERKGMDPAQISGATSSYARKYALNGLFLIDDTKDADSKNNSPSGGSSGKSNGAPSSQTSIPMTVYQKTTLLELAKKKGKSEEALNKYALKAFKVDIWTKLDKTQAGQAINTIMKLEDKAPKPTKVEDASMTKSEDWDKKDDPQEDLGDAFEKHELEAQNGKETVTGGDTK